MAEDGGVEAGRHGADDLAAGEDHAALDRRRAGHGEAEQAALVGQVRGPLQRPLAEEVGLVHLDGPVHPDPPGRGVELGVLAHDDVALLQPQPEQGLQAVGPDAEVGARLEQGLPQLDRGVDAVVQLEAGLAGEGEPHEVAVDPRDGLVAVLEEAGRVVDAEPAEELGRARPGDVDRPEGHRAVEDVHPQAPRLQPVPDPHLGRRRAAGGEGQGEAGLVVPADHAVVDDVAPLVQQEHVAGPPGPDVVHVVRVEALERLDDVRPRDDHLAEGRDVTDADALADGVVLRAQVAVASTAATSRRSGRAGRRGGGARRGAACGGRRRCGSPRPPRPA